MKSESNITDISDVTDIIYIAIIIDFSLNGLSTENRLRSQRTSKPYKI